MRQRTALIDYSLTSRAIPNLLAQPVAEIVQCGLPRANDSRTRGYEISQPLVAQVIDFIELNELARRTGRFPQLVDPRSSVNGLLLTGSPRFREVSLEVVTPPCRLKQSAPLMPTPPAAETTAECARSAVPWTSSDSTVPESSTGGLLPEERLETVLSHLAGSSSLNRAEGVVDDVPPPVGSATGHISGRAGHVHVGSIGGLPC